MFIAVPFELQSVESMGFGDRPLSRPAQTRAMRCTRPSREQMVFQDGPLVLGLLLATPPRSLALRVHIGGATGSGGEAVVVTVAKVLGRGSVSALHARQSGRSGHAACFDTHARCKPGQVGLDRRFVLLPLAS